MGDGLAGLIHGVSDVRERPRGLRPSDDGAVGVVTLEVEIVRIGDEGWRIRPCFAVCSKGRERWFWCVWENREAWFNQAAALSQGYAPSREDALAAARAVVDGEVELPAKFADGYHRRLAVAQRLQRQSTATEAAPLEFVWRWSSGDGDFPDRWFAHQIMRRTATRVFVDHDIYRVDRTRRTDVYTFAIDRAVLERDGYAFSKRFHGIVYSEEGRARREAEMVQRIGHSVIPSALRELGLGHTATRREVQQAYRRIARTVHPDRGGTDDAFQKLTRAYEQALMQVMA